MFYVHIFFTENYPPPHNKYANIAILTILFGLPFTDISLPQWFGIDYLINWWVWFYLGYVIYQYREYVLSIIKKYYLYVLLFAIYIGLNLIDYTNNETITLYNRTATLCAVIFFWSIINILLQIKNGKWATNKFFTEINSVSYGIFIFHNWFQMYMISRTAQRILPLEQWAADHVVLFPLLFFICSFILSYIATKITLKTRIGRFLIG